MKIPRLTYFEMRGRAEAIRLLLHATHTDFEDKRVVSSDEWAALQQKVPFGVLPIYESPQGCLAESQAILRHLGRRLLPANQSEPNVTELDVAQEALAESQEHLWRFNWSENYYDRLEAYAQETVRPRLRRLQRWLNRDRHGECEWFGAAFSHVDCLAFCYLDEVDAFFPVVLAEFDDLAVLRLRVAALPGISNYLQSSSRPMVFGLGRMGLKVDPRVPIPSDSRYFNPWTTDPIDLAEVARRQRRLT